jgi:hypothetical protein
MFITSILKYFYFHLLDHLEGTPKKEVKGVKRHSLSHTLLT